MISDEVIITMEVRLQMKDIEGRLACWGAKGYIQ